MCRVASHSVSNLYRLRKGLNLVPKVFSLGKIPGNEVEKAFDSIYRESLWKILHHNGISQKIIDPIKALYNDFHCRVIHDSDLTEPFSANSGVKQGCLLSPLLYLKSRLGHEENLGWPTPWNLMDAS